MDSIGIGKIGQSYAEEFLRKKGYRLVERNWRAPFGEIDIIFRLKEDLVFVEVKTLVQKTDSFHPEDHFTAAKQGKLIRLAAFYINGKNLGTISYQIDLAAVDVDVNLNLLEIRHYPNVVEDY